MLDYKIIAVDFDGCLCTSAWPEIGSPNTELIEALIRIRKMGHKVILWTCRTRHYLSDAVQWCNDHGLYFDAVNANLDDLNSLYDGNDSRKIGADIYIDDKAMRLVCLPGETTSINDLLTAIKE